MPNDHYHRMENASSHDRRHPDVSVDPRHKNLNWNEHVVSDVVTWTPFVEQFDVTPVRLTVAIQKIAIFH